MKRLLPVVVLVVVLAGALVVPASAAHSPQTVTYTVQPGDTLASISRQFCTTWQQIYTLNRATIGPDPNAIEPGMVLQVPNKCGGNPPPCNVDGQCGGQPQPCSVYDHGPTLHARGSVQGNVYTVVLGDTSFSVSKRFGLTVDQLAAANGLHNPNYIYAGQKLIIPGLGSCPPKPGKPFITINNPAPGARLPATFTVSGTGGGLFEGSLVVRALNSAGAVLAQQPVTLQGADVGTGGTGTYSVQLTVNVSPNTAGKIVASSTSPKDGSIVASATVPVTFNAGTCSGGACKPFITISSPAPGAQLPATFTVSGTGGGLFEGNVVVRAVNSGNQVLAEQATTLQGANVGAGGTGTYSVQLSVQVTANTPGQIIAYSPSPSGSGNLASASAAVTFTPSSSTTTYKDYAPGQCKIWAKSGAPFYTFPGGPQAGYFGAGGVFEAVRGAKVSGVYWYQMATAPGSHTPSVWVPTSSTTKASAGCAF